MPVGNPDSLAERSLMFLARPFPFLLAVLLSVMPGFSLAAEDAAIEVQEGDIKHWIEYYKKERGGSNEMVTTDPPVTEPSAEGDGKPAGPIEQAPAGESGNR